MIGVPTGYGAVGMRYAQVELSVLHGDALTYHADLLALKHAQKLYGVDLAVATAARIDSQALPEIGEELVVRQPIGVGAENLLFVGTQSLLMFGYEEIRRFSQSALTAAAKLTPAVREVCLTLHGVASASTRSKPSSPRSPESSRQSTPGTIRPSSVRSPSSREMKVEHGGCDSA